MVAGSLLRLWAGCAQGPIEVRRLLLRMAAEKGNINAKQSLENLNKDS